MLLLRQNIKTKKTYQRNNTKALSTITFSSKLIKKLVLESMLHFFEEQVILQIRTWLLEWVSVLLVNVKFVFKGRSFHQLTPVVNFIKVKIGCISNLGSAPNF